VRRSPRLPLEELAPFLLPLPEAPAPFDWTALFGNGHPVELEVGFGKGLFLVSAGPARPDVNFVGVEIVRKYQLFTATRLAKRGLRNVKVACGDGHAFLRDLTPPASLAALHVYFPDPWWKKRHHKRRLFTEEFAAVVPRVLCVGGRFHFVTDVEDYFRGSCALLAAHPTLRSLPPPEPAGPAHDLDYLTNFERKFRKESRPIWRALYERAAEAEWPEPGA
jgi:tRNA (guanine-N7-)-methyltransferase